MRNYFCIGILCFVFLFVEGSLVIVKGQGNSGNNVQGTVSSSIIDFNCPEDEAVPPFLSSHATPKTLLVVSKDHTLFTGAYDEYSDIDGDGAIDTDYNPDPDVRYGGYFNTDVCYTYSEKFTPTANATADKTCDGTAEWSGDFLNYLTMSRMDLIRRGLYGGSRFTDSDSATVLERAFIPADSHAWGHSYSSEATDGYDISQFSPLSSPSSGRHLLASLSGGTSGSPGEPVLRVREDTSSTIEDWLNGAVPVAQSGVGDGTYSDYTVRVDVCVEGFLESNCRLYPGTDGIRGTSDDIYKPQGILQNYGTSGRVEFGLMTGSYIQPDDGGILRVEIGDISSEVDNTTGQINDAVQGIIATVDTLQIVDFDGSVYSPEDRNVGNPVAEMLYEGIRYLQGAGSPTSDFIQDLSGSDDLLLDIPALTSWNDPLSSGTPWCTDTSIVLISGDSVSYDGDTNFSDLSGVDSLLDTISSTEGINGTVLTGAGNFCTATNVAGLDTANGICLETPSQLGTYNAPAVAYYGKKTDLSSAVDKNQTVSTQTVLLPPAYHQVEIPGVALSFLPVAHTDGDSGPAAITAIYAETVNATAGSLRVAFDPEQPGASNTAADAVVDYAYSIDNSTITFSLDATGVPTDPLQRYGVAVSGTESDGTIWIASNNATATNLATQNATSLSLLDGGSATLLNSPLWFTAKWGGFQEGTDDSPPFPEAQGEWDRNGDGFPDAYRLSVNGFDLERDLYRAVGTALNRRATGAGSSVVTGSQPGVGALYQALFWSEYNDDNGNTVDWVGDVHAFLLDAEGNMYEDTNQNGQWDTADESIQVYYDSGLEKTRACVGGVYNGTACNGTVTELMDVKYLWSVAEWLNDPQLNTVDNAFRSGSDYISDVQERYIFSWFDADNDGAVDDTSIDGSGEVTYFSVDTFTDDSARGDALGAESAADVVRWLRGQEVSEMRSRAYKQNGASRVWRLGDVISSTPALVTKPSERYDILWGDESYSAFYQKYKNRRHMVYFGGNDGMIHAVNGGFFNAEKGKYYLDEAMTVSADSPTANTPELGAEMWAYVPYNLLPHLKCLTDPFYNHQYYVDLAPRVFDVRIWEDDFDDPDAVHANGWGTILVCGMRLGGTGVDVEIQGEKRHFSSSYVIFDITDPENPPTLLGEFTFPYSSAQNDKKLFRLGYTMTVPSLVPKIDPSNTDSGTSLWYLVVGSGPDAVPLNQFNAESTQKAFFTIVPLHELPGGLSLQVDKSDNQAPNLTTPGVAEFPNSESYLATDLVAVDYDRNFRTDIFYYGWVESGSGQTDWDGGVGRLRVEDKNKDTSSPQNWDVHKLIDAGRPVTSAPNVTFKEDDVWVYFGTGRYFVSADTGIADTQQYFVGVKEPKKTDGTGYNFNTVALNNIDNLSNWVLSSNIEVLSGENGKLECIGGGDYCLPTDVAYFDELAEYLVEDAKHGWVRELPSQEMVVSQPSLFGGAVSYTSYKPSTDECSGQGSSSLTSVYAFTGTAWVKNIFGEPDDADNDGYVDYIRDIGKGLSLTPTIHIGDEPGATMYVQSSTGAVTKAAQPNLPNPAGLSGDGGVGWHTHDLE